VQRTLGAQEGGVADRVGIDAAGQERVIVESKFWAVNRSGT
jgi:hypothetical protein